MIIRGGNKLRIRNPHLSSTIKLAALGTTSIRTAKLMLASGWHTAAITLRLMVEGGLPIVGGLVGAGAEISWLKPTLVAKLIVPRRS